MKAFVRILGVAWLMGACLGCTDWNDEIDNFCDIHKHELDGMRYTYKVDPEDGWEYWGLKDEFELSEKQMTELKNGEYTTACVSYWSNLPACDEEWRNYLSCHYKESRRGMTELGCDINTVMVDNMETYISCREVYVAQNCTKTYNQYHSCKLANLSEMNEYKNSETQAFCNRVKQYAHDKWKMDIQESCSELFGITELFLDEPEQP